MQGQPKAVAIRFSSVPLLAGLLLGGIVSGTVFTVELFGGADTAFGIPCTVLLEPDTDGDGLCDFDETNIYGTDPNNPDSDFDGWWDGPEVFITTSPLNPCHPGWPPDPVAFNSEGENKVLIDDIFFVAGRFNEGVGGGNYTPRAEIASQNGIIGIDDVFAVTGRFGDTTC